MTARPQQCLTILVLLSAGCIAESSPTEVSLARQPLTEFLDATGRRFVLEIANVATTDLPEGVSPEHMPVRDEVEAKLEELSRDELAEALRPVMFRDGNQYKLDAPDYDAADLAIAMRDANWPAGESGRGILNSDKEEEEPIEKHFCCGTDNRTAKRNEVAWPYATIGVLASASSIPIGWTTNADWSSASSSCTMTLIGEQTAVSAAHCFYTFGSGWMSSRMWGFAADKQDSVGPIEPGYPQGRGMYNVSVPSAYVSGGSSSYDWAVIDFHDNVDPGFTAGWLGWGCYGAEIENTQAEGMGFPADAGSLWPQLRGHLVYNVVSSLQPRILGVNGTFIQSQMDSNGGQSGQAFIQFLDGGHRVTGVHLGHWPGSTTSMRDKQFTSSVCSSIVSWSDEF